MDMASSLIDSITCALLLSDQRDEYGRSVLPVELRLSLMIGLNNLKALLICLRGLRNDDDDDDDDWGLYSRIRDAVQSISPERVDDFRKSRGNLMLFKEIADKVHFLAVDVDAELLNRCSRSFGALKVDHIVGILDSILDIAVRFQRLVMIRIKLGLGKEFNELEAMEVQITFMKHFLIFAIQTGVDHQQLQNVLIHIQPFVINAVRVFKNDTTKCVGAIWIENVRSKCSAAMTTDPQVYQAFAQALRTSSLSSTRSNQTPDLHMDDDIFDISRNFLDSIISVLWGVLRSSDSIKDREKVLYERLRFSRSILKQPINFIEKKMRDQIGSLICDAAIMLMSSLHQTDVGNMSHLGLSDLLLRFDVFQIDMDMASSLIDSITRALLLIDPKITYGYTVLPLQLYVSLSIGLMNLKALLIFLTKLRNVDADDDDDDSGLYSRICDAVHSISPERVADFWKYSLSWHVKNQQFLEIAHKVHFLGVDAHAELLNRSSRSFSALKVDQIVGILDSILDVAVLFPCWVRSIRPELGIEYEEVEAMDVQITFTKHFLIFAIQTGVDHQQLQNVLIHIQPLVTNAVRVFMHDKTGPFGWTWIDNVRSKCSAVMTIDPQVYQAFAHALTTSSLSSTRSNQTPDLHMDDDIFDISRNFLDSIISVLWGVLRASCSRKDSEKVLYERLRFSRSILKRQPINFIEKKMRDQIGSLICDAAIMLISSLHQTDVGNMSDLGLSDLLLRFDVFQASVDANNSQTLQLNSPKPKYPSMGDSTSTSISISHGKEKVASSSHQPPRNACSFQDDEVLPVVNRLIRGSKELRIVPIIGMAGLGKTTFALEIYNLLSISYHFHARAWCSISQVLDKRRVFLQLLNQIKPGDYTSNKSEDDLADELRKSLKGLRYLIFLDDVWTPEVWNSLMEALPNDSTQSRVILTSRHRHIAPCGLISDGEPHLLRPREVKECLEIMQAKLSPEKPLELNEFGMKFAEKCKGLPLIAVIVAGLLAATEQKDWKLILDSLSSGGLYGEEHCNNALELSFKHLPDELKLCFMYFSAFPEDEEVYVKRLIGLWMAEGFIRKTDTKSVEDVGREYLDKLVDRSLVTVARIRSIGGVKTCRIHDLLHEFCTTKAKVGNFLYPLQQRLDQLSDFNEPRNLQRLSIQSDLPHFQKSMLFCPGVHSLLFFCTSSQDNRGGIFHMAYIIQIYKLLRVLDMGQIVLRNQIPNEIGLLIRLTFLSIRSYSKVIPSSIGNLTNLETFIAQLQQDGYILFPHCLWNLQKLKCLHIGHNYTYPSFFTLPDENTENSSVLLELESLSGIEFSSVGSMGRQMKRFPNVRRLSCHILPDVNSMEDSERIVAVSDIPQQLVSLTITGGKGSKKFPWEFGSAENLRKLKLMYLQLSREGIRTIGGFPNLEVLKLAGIHYEGNVLEMEEGEFSKLRYLELYDDYDSPTYKLEKWIASDEQLPNLQKLVLDSCYYLNEIPSCLETIPTLEEIELFYCYKAVKTLVRGIKKVREDYGNSIKVRTHRYSQR